MHCHSDNALPQCVAGRASLLQGHSSSSRTLLFFKDTPLLQGHHHDEKHLLFDDEALLAPLFSGHHDDYVALLGPLFNVMLHSFLVSLAIIMSKAVLLGRASWACYSCSHHVESDMFPP